MKTARIIFTLNLLIVCSASFASSSSTQRSWDEKMEIDALAVHIKHQILEKRAQQEGYTSPAAQNKHEQEIARKEQESYFNMLENESSSENMMRINNFHEAIGRSQNPYYHQNRPRLTQEEFDKQYANEEAQIRYQHIKENESKYQQQKQAMLSELLVVTQQIAERSAAASTFCSTFHYDDGTQETYSLTFTK